jgi:hypothetical protein
LDKQPILVHARGCGVVVHLLVGHNEADTAARPDEPVRAPGDDAPLGVARQRSIRIEVIDPRKRCPALHALADFNEARRSGTSLLPSSSPPPPSAAFLFLTQIGARLESARPRATSTAKSNR